MCRLRWAVIGFWIAACVASVLWLPSIGEGGGGGLGSLVPEHAAALTAEIESATQFKFPLLARTMIVQQDPRGLPAKQQVAATRLARLLTEGALPGYRGHILGALPVSNALGSPPFSRQHSTSVLTYLFFTTSDSAARRETIAERLVRQRVAAPPAGGVAGVTGEAPAQAEEAVIINHHLTWVEIATVLLVAVAMAVRFRSVGAPFVALDAVAVSFVVSSHLIAWIGQLAGLSVPQQVEPVMVVLILGVVTDYSIFFLSRFREGLEMGEPRLAAARDTAAEISPIVGVAGFTVAAATAALLVAHLAFFRAFGPGLAATVVVCVAVVLTLVPAILACFGSLLYWPTRPTVRDPKPEDEVRSGWLLGRYVNGACDHPWLAIVLCLAAIGAGASGLYTLRLANPVVRGLPRTAMARKTYHAATQAFAPGVLSPTVLLVNAPGITSRRPALTRLQALIGHQPGLALVLGPGDNPLHTSFGAALATNGNAARYFIILSSDPLGAQAISTLRHLQARMPRLLRRAHLSGTKVAFAGDTALSAETINDTLGDLGRIAPASLIAMLMILIIYLRALVAPLYLIAASLLSFAAALGIGVYVFQGLLGEGGLSFFVPFVSAVLLVSLGSDYNVFLIGTIWREARARTLRAATPIAARNTAKPITVAGFILAGSFALLAIIPLEEFRQIAFIMAVGLLIDTLLVRTILVPALVTLVGPLSRWPSHESSQPPAASIDSDR